MMFSKLSPRSNVKRVLFITLSNIGDVVMTFPVFDRLKECFPEAEFYVLAGPKARGFFNANPYVTKFFSYDKKMPWKAKLRWFLELRGHRFDLIVDIRNSMLPFILQGRYITPPVLGARKGHMQKRHLSRLSSVLEIENIQPKEPYALFVSFKDEASARAAVFRQKDYIVIAPGAADSKKRWTEEGFVEVIKFLQERTAKRIVIVGDRKDMPVVDRILKKVPSGIINTCGFTSLVELAAVLKNASLALTNDSGVMHLASYYNIPTVALFGPTDPALYGPWSLGSVVLHKGTIMDAIVPEDVINELKQRLP